MTTTSPKRERQRARIPAAFGNGNPVVDEVALATAAQAATDGIPNGQVVMEESIMQGSRRENVVSSILDFRSRE